MRTAVLVASFLVFAACGGSESAGAAVPAVDFASVAAAHGGRCDACHALPSTVEVRFARPRSALVAMAQRLGAEGWSQNDCPNFVRDGSADAIAWLQSLVAAAPAFESAAVRPAAAERGRALLRELACAACHTEAEFERLPRTIDHAQLGAFLVDPAARHPGLSHVALPRPEAVAVAAWLLRSQAQETALVHGFAFECFERTIEGGGQQDVHGLEPAARGVTDVIDADVRSRDNNIVLQFAATIEVPATGDWTFTVGSDDGSWLWIDDALVVDNAGLKPHKRLAGTVPLTAGPHALRVAYTQGRGDKSLEVLWQGPGVEQQALPASCATASAAALVPPAIEVPEPTEDAVARGRRVARAGRCDACHWVQDEAYLALPAPAAARSWQQLEGGSCIQADDGGLRASLGDLAEQPVSAAGQLRLALRDDGCLKCHVRDGEGGLAPDVVAQLTEVEDLGDEGRLPPDLTAVGRRLRPAWIARVIADGHKVRDYVKVRMPAFGEARAQQYAAWFTAIDAEGVVDVEPPFSAASAELGRNLVGTGGRNCITCHSVQGHASLGPQGMDLGLQFERVRPGWFRDWLLHPTELRPGTRMPTLWLRGDQRDIEEVDAIRAWSALGEAAPLPTGIVVDPSSYVLEPIERPILHGAFLKDVSARCLAVGTPQRTHFAYDLASQRLVWLWRGSFLDARGTWHGRAGQLLEPLGKQLLRLDDFVVDGAAERRLLGQRRTADGYPVLRVAAGEVLYEDEARARLAPGGSEVVRTIRCEAGSLTLEFPAVEGCSIKVAGKPAGRHALAAGQSLEVVYQW